MSVDKFRSVKRWSVLVSCVFLSYIFVSIVRSPFVNNWGHVGGVGVFLDAFIYSLVLAAPIYWYARSPQSSAIAILTTTILCLLFISTVLNGFTDEFSVVDGLFFSIVFTLPLPIGLIIGTHLSKERGLT